MSAELQIDSNMLSIALGQHLRAPSLKLTHGIVVNAYRGVCN